MKTQTFIRLSLLFPYVLWVALAIFIAVISKFFPPSDTLSALYIILTISVIYTFGIVVWGIPYTVIALGLWIWSKGRPVYAMIKVFALSPLMMAVLVAIAMFLLIGRDNSVSSDFGESVLALGAFSMLYGYGIIGIVAALYKLLQRGSFIQPENEIPPTQST